MEAELARTRNLESLGILAGGIAHDFNNILAVILGNLNLVKIDLDPLCEGFECTTEAEQATHQAKALARQLLTFAKGGAPVKKTAVLSEAIRESCGFAVRGSNVRCEYAIEDPLWPVEADVEQMGQVLNNLFINAKQAMPGGGLCSGGCP
jgi:signal transduction histidine kinase